MFGIFRTLLALAVVSDHLGGTAYSGPYAVFGFYALSGYLMTLILHRTYGYSPAGLGRYAANRLLRIMPVYLLAALLSLALVWALGEAWTRAFHENIGSPASMEEWLRNLFLVLSISTDTRLVPPAWALTVELSFYLLIGLGLSRTRLICFLWLAASVAYTAYLLHGNASFSYRYYTMAAASLPFSMGASLYHVRQMTRGGAFERLIERPWIAPGLAVALFANYAAARAASASLAQGGLFYLNLILMVALIAHLSSRSPTTVDQRIGDLSYPIYLTHFQAGLLVTWAIADVSRGTALFLAASLLPVLTLAWLVKVFVEAPIERLRTQIKPQAESISVPAGR